MWKRLLFVDMYLCPCRVSHPLCIALSMIDCMHGVPPSTAFPPFSACLSLSISVYLSNGDAFIHSVSVYTLLLLSMLSLLSLSNVCCFIYLFSSKNCFGKCSLGCDGFRPTLGGRNTTHLHKLLFGMCVCVCICVPMGECGPWFWRAKEGNKPKMGSHSSSIHHISAIVAIHISAHALAHGPWEWVGPKNSGSGPIRHSCSFSVFLLFFFLSPILLPSFFLSFLPSFHPFILHFARVFVARSQSHTHTLTPTRHYPSFLPSFSGGRVLPFSPSKPPLPIESSFSTSTLISSHPSYSLSNFAVSLLCLYF